MGSQKTKTMFSPGKRVKFSATKRGLKWEAVVVCPLELAGQFFHGTKCGSDFFDSQTSLSRSSSSTVTNNSNNNNNQNADMLGNNRGAVLGDIEYQHAPQPIIQVIRLCFYCFSK